MTVPELVVEISPGVYARKSVAHLQPTAAVVFGGGPAAFTQATEFQRQFDAEITAAGGLAAWRERASPNPP